jgi:Trk K+ transport system NAD-binding subunit
VFKKSIIIVSVFRDGTVIIPTGDTVIKEHDEVHMLCQAKNIHIVKKLFRIGKIVPM